MMQSKPLLSMPANDCAMAATIRATITWKILALTIIFVFCIKNLNKMTDKKKTSRKVRDENKYEYAGLLFTQSVTQADIASKVGIAEKTLSRWIHDNDWHSRRAATNVTRDELVNKTLGVIDSLLEKAMEEKNPSKLADQLSKLAGAIRNLDKQATVVDVVQVFMAFNKWLSARISFDPEITQEILKTINKYQDMFINEKLSLQK